MTCRNGSAGESPGPLIAIAAMVSLLAPCLLVAACSSAATPAASSRERLGLAATAGPLARPRTPEAGGTGLRLLQEAAEAGSGTSYQGVELVSTWGVDGNSMVIANVWHRSGGSTVVQVAPAGMAGPGQNIFDDTDGRTPEGVLGVTSTLVTLLGMNYDVTYAGLGSADSRPAQIVEARRADGRLAARFWLDKATKLPLRREVFDSGARLIGEDVFIDIKLGTPAVTAAPADVIMPWRQRLTPVALAQMRARGWPVPGALPEDLSLFEAEEATTSSGKVLDLGYSDGLSVVSVFIQRGDLAPKLAGWQKIRFDGRLVYAGQSDQRSLTWAGHGFVFTVMADAPPATLDAVVDALPYSSPPGFWERLSRGFGRLASWANPFR
jgi:sigma-E factor negative regulatory protein RseB